MSKNLFIVNTPFHLLTAFILIKGMYTKDENYLALVHPHGYEKWKDSKIMQYMSSKDCGYKMVYPLIGWMTKNENQPLRQQVREIQYSVGKIQYDQIFLGSDIDMQNQLLVGALHHKHFYRFEDGLYSYFNEDRRRPYGHMIFHRIKMHIIMLLSGIKNRVNINTSTAGDSKSGIGDFMYKPQLLQRYSPKTYEIDRFMIVKAIDSLKKNNFLQPLIRKDAILYLSQPLVEQKKFAIEEELTILKKVYSGLKDGLVLVYKPHPKDSDEKIAFYKEEIPELMIFDSIVPMELLFAYEDKIKAVISYQSTALLFPDKFSTKKIKSISLALFYNDALHPAYIDIMKRAGVFFPANINEVIEMLYMP